jgi:hypothetical protein
LGAPWGHLSRLNCIVAFLGESNWSRSKVESRHPGVDQTGSIHHQGAYRGTQRRYCAPSVQAYAEGKISPAEMPRDPDNKRNAVLRYAPSFSPDGKTGGPVYTSESLAKFLGMTESTSGQPQEKFKAAFGALV